MIQMCDVACRLHPLDQRILRVLKARKHTGCHLRDILGSRMLQTQIGRMCSNSASRCCGVARQSHHVSPTWPTPSLVPCTTHLKKRYSMRTSGTGLARGFCRTTPRQLMANVGNCPSQERHLKALLHRVPPPPCSHSLHRDCCHPAQFRLKSHKVRCRGCPLQNWFSAVPASENATLREIPVL